MFRQRAPFSRYLRIHSPSPKVHSFKEILRDFSTVRLTGKSIRPSSGRNAFTLLELVVAVSIVLILAALVFPLRDSFLAGGKTVQCISRLKSWSSAISSYSAENQGVVVAYQIESPYEPWASLGDAGPYWRYFINNNLKEGKVVQLLRRCPADPTTAPSYAFNKAIHNMRLAAVARLAKTLLLVDSKPNVLYLENSDASWSDRIVTRHANKANVLFLDGHVETLDREAILALRQENPATP